MRIREFDMILHLLMYICFSFGFTIFSPSNPYIISIVDVNSSLVDDGLVEKDKIGGSNFFWSFPGKKDRMLQLEHERVLAETEAAKGRIAEAEAKLADAKRGREDDDGERPKKLARLIELRKSKERLQKELEVLKANDPQSLADYEKELQLVREGAERWTDNIFKVRSLFGAILFGYSLSSHFLH